MPSRTSPPRSHRSKSCQFHLCIVVLAVARGICMQILRTGALPHCFCSLLRAGSAPIAPECVQRSRGSVWCDFYRRSKFQLGWIELRFNSADTAHETQERTLKVSITFNNHRVQVDVVPPMRKLLKLQAPLIPCNFIVENTFWCHCHYSSTSSRFRLRSSAN
jgi:hypothetical protein